MRNFFFSVFLEFIEVFCVIFGTRKRSCGFIYLIFVIRELIFCFVFG